jgi:hypothetical protein
MPGVPLGTHVLMRWWGCCLMGYGIWLIVMGFVFSISVLPASHLFAACLGGEKSGTEGLQTYKPYVQEVSVLTQHLISGI